jgi:hypothetical protein
MDFHRSGLIGLVVSTPGIVHHLPTPPVSSGHQPFSSQQVERTTGGWHAHADDARKHPDPRQTADQNPAVNARPQLPGNLLGQLIAHHDSHAWQSSGFFHFVQAACTVTVKQIGTKNISTFFFPAVEGYFTSPHVLLCVPDDLPESSTCFPLEAGACQQLHRSSGSGIILRFSARRTFSVPHPGIHPNRSSRVRHSLSHIPSIHQSNPAIRNPKNPTTPIPLSLP